MKTFLIISLLLMTACGSKGGGYTPIKTQLICGSADTSTPSILCTGGNLDQAVVNLDLAHLPGGSLSNVQVVNGVPGPLPPLGLGQCISGNCTCLTGSYSSGAAFALCGTQVINNQLVNP